MKVIIQYQDLFGRWLRYTEKHNEADAYRVATRRATSVNKRHRLIDNNGSVLDIIYP